MAHLKNLGVLAGDSDWSSPPPWEHRAARSTGGHRLTLGVGKPLCRLVARGRSAYVETCCLRNPDRIPSLSPGLARSAGLPRVTGPGSPTLKELDQFLTAGPNPTIRPAP